MALFKRPLARGLLAGVVVAALALTLFTTTQPAAAYTLQGPRWHGPTGGCCLYLYPQYSQWMYTADYGVWDNGRAAWNNDANANIFYGKTSSSVIYLTDTNISGTSWDGEFTCHSNGGYFTDCTATLNYYYISQYLAAGDSGRAQSIAAHELGHIGGLGEMYSGCELMRIDSWTRYEVCGDDVPIGDDENGINYLY